MNDVLSSGAAPALWPAVWKLIRLRGVIFLSGFRRAKLRRKIGIIVVGLLVLGFVGFIFAMSWVLLGFLRSPQLSTMVGEARPFLDTVPSLIMGGAFLGILLTSFGVLLQALYLAGDMDFLLSTPVPIRAVFLTKMLQAILPNFSLISLFSLPVLWGLGASGHYNILYYPAVLVALAALALGAAGLSSLLVMLVVRVFPARRVAEVLGFMGAIFSILCSQSGQIANMNRFTPTQASDAVQLASRFDSPWSPLAWTGRGLVALGEGNWLAAAGFLVLSLGLATALFAVALTTAERLYYSGWASMQGNGRKKKSPRPGARLGQTGRGAGRAALPLAAVGMRIPATLRALLFKDYLVLRRDLRNLSQLVTPLIFGIVYAVMFLRQGGEAPAGQGEAPAWFMEIMKNLMLYGNVAISLFVGWMLLSRLAGMGFSQEGKSYWMIKTAPVSVRQLVQAKFLVAFLPALALGWLFLLGISLIQRASLQVLLFSLPVVALCIAGNTGINLTFGVLGANFNWEDPRHMQRGGIGCLGTLASVAYLPISLLLFFGPAVGLSLLQIPEGVGQLAGLLIGGIFSLACAIVPLWLVRGRVSLLGED